MQDEKRNANLNLLSQSTHHIGFQHSKKGGRKKVSLVNFSNEWGQALNHIQLVSNKLVTEVQETVSCSMSLEFNIIPHSF
jgi:hypothetical protein